MLKVTNSRKGCAVGGKSKPSSKEVTAPSGLIAVFEYDCDETSDRRQAPTSMLAMFISPAQHADAERSPPDRLKAMMEFQPGHNRQICRGPQFSMSETHNPWQRKRRRRLNCPATEGRPVSRVPCAQCWASCTTRLLFAISTAGAFPRSDHSAARAKTATPLFAPSRS